MSATESGSVQAVTDSEKVELFAEYFHNVHRVEPDRTGKQKRTTIIAKEIRKAPHAKIPGGTADTPRPTSSDRESAPATEADSPPIIKDAESTRSNSPIHPYFLEHPEESPYHTRFWTDEAFAKREPEEVQRQASREPEDPVKIPVYLPVERELCWRCGQPGHTRGSCQRKRPLLFCSRCGLKDILFRDCPCEAPAYSEEEIHPRRERFSAPCSRCQCPNPNQHIECPDCGCSAPMLMSYL
ncbi:hypothetical protein JTB14_006957 [Gonioctena quinquepunctata]|nr:hypothetical protein JTB14_006957 [Gonioctena quinquepunctata]